MQNNSNNDEKTYTLRLTEQQYRFLHHLWGPIHQEFLADVRPESSWWQWGIDMQQAMRQAEIEHNNQKTGE